LPPPPAERVQPGAPPPRSGRFVVSWTRIADFMPVQRLLRRAEEVAKATVVWPATTHSVQLAIPHAPRPVSLRQVPGATRRVGLVALIALAGAIVLTALAWALTRWITDDARFLRDATAVEGTVVSVAPTRDRARTAVQVIYRFDERQHTAPVQVDSERASGLGKGARVDLLVRASEPERPRERLTTEASAGQGPLLGAVVVIAVVAALLVVARELRRAMRREVEPLRTGLLVWLTPNEALPPRAGEFAFPAHFYRDDRRVDVTARLHGARRPVRNGEKLLAAVAPREPNWVRVVDEEVARSLGWYR
jgi:hypothetical protein